MKFRRDLALGSKGEAYLQAILEKAGWKTELNTDSRKNKDYDIKACKDEQAITFEVKYDVYAARSGNIAIEFYNPKICQPSGIDSTKATFWAHIITDPMSVWVAPVAQLKSFLKTTPAFRVITCGGDDNSSMYLYKKEVILSKVFTRIDECDETSLRGILLCPSLTGGK